MTDLPNWFEMTARPSFEKWLLPRAGEDLMCLQIGAFTGDASLWLLENLPKAVLWDVDTWEGSEEHADLDFEQVEREYERQMAPYRYGNRLTVAIGTSEEFWDQEDMAESYDFVYVDGDHHAATVLSDAVHAWRWLRPGGLLAFDDYAWQHELGSAHEPRTAIDAFLACFDGQYQLLERYAQVWVRKKVATE